MGTAVDLWSTFVGVSVVVVAQTEHEWLVHSPPILFHHLCGKLQSRQGCLIYGGLSPPWQRASPASHFTTAPYEARTAPRTAGLQLGANRQAQLE